MKNHMAIIKFQFWHLKPHPNVNPNLLTLESLAGMDTMAGHPTSILCVADDETPSSSNPSPRIAISDMQVLLSAVETHGSDFHISYGVPKCKLLVSARPAKKKETLDILNSEPESLTFFNKPVSLVEDKYVHLGVPQALNNQSKTVMDYQLSKGMAMSYLMQPVNKNAYLEVSPLTNDHLTKCYHLPIFMFGLETLNINLLDLDRFDTNYRSVLKGILSLPDSVASCAVYLSIGQLPITAERDWQPPRPTGSLSL